MRRARDHEGAAAEPGQPVPLAGMVALDAVVSSLPTKSRPCGISSA